MIESALDETYFGSAQETCRKNSILFTHGTPVHSVYFVLEGGFSVRRTEERNANARDYVFEEVGPGGVLGLDECLVEQERYTASARAVANSKLLRVTPSELKDKLFAEPEMLQSLLVWMTKRKLRSDRKRLDLAVLDVLFRTSLFLLERTKSPEAVVFDRPDLTGVGFKMTQDDIADHVGCSREMVARILKELEADGYIGHEGRMLVIFGTKK